MSNGVTPAIPAMRMDTAPSHFMVSEVIGLVHVYGGCGTKQVFSMVISQAAEQVALQPGVPSQVSPSAA